MYEKCSICHENMIDPTKKYQIKECKHNFHLDCIIRWWRSPREQFNEYGTCPLCRALPALEGKWNNFSRQSRVKVLKELIKTKNVHKNIKTSIHKLETAETEMQKIEREKKIFLENKKTKEIFKKQNSLIRRLWKARKKVNECTIEASQYDPMSLIDLYVE